jgi:hypothetical protein
MRVVQHVIYISTGELPQVLGWFNYFLNLLLLPWQVGVPNMSDTCGALKYRCAKVKPGDYRCGA